MKIINKKITAVFCGVSLMASLTGCGKSTIALPYEISTIAKEAELSSEISSFQVEPFAKDLCVADANYVIPENLDFQSLEAFGLFDLTANKVIHNKNMNEKLYPASTTKIMTAYLALKYGNLDDRITVSETAVAQPSDASLCHLHAGDQMKLSDVLRGMMMRSGNEAATAIAEYISGSVDEFANLMNEEAQKMGAVNSHFVNPHGYHDDDHYTCVYDMYLIFNQAIQFDEFREIINTANYTVQYSDSNGSPCSMEWTNTNRYLLGAAAIPDGITVIGGKTGTTSLAGSCLVLLSKDSTNGREYVSIVFKATDHNVLYEDMTGVLKQIPVGDAAEPVQEEMTSSDENESDASEDAYETEGDSYDEISSTAPSEGEGFKLPSEESADNMQVTESVDGTAEASENENYTTQELVPEQDSTYSSADTGVGDPEEQY